MGRTLPSIIQSFQAEEEMWKLFRRALRTEDQEAFDYLWSYARRHAAPASMASRPVPLEAILMCMLVGLQRRQLDSEGKCAARHKALEKNAEGSAGGVAL